MSTLFDPSAMTEGNPYAVVPSGDGPAPSGPDFTQWPTAADVFARLASVGITPRVSQDSSRVTTLLLAVPADVTQRTRRQFVADTDDTTRVFDGTGTPELEIDEMVSFTSATVFGLQAQPGYQLAGVILKYEQGLPQTRLIVGQGSVPALITEGVYAPISYMFPAGRLNIGVTARFGYGAQIPFDLWEAVCCEEARRLAGEALFTPSGRLQVRKAGDEEERYKLDGTDALDWPDYDAAVKFYTRPSGRKHRNLRNRMI